MTEDATPLVRRGRRNARYTAISNDLIDHPTLSPEARVALIYLLSKPDDWRLQMNDVRRLLGRSSEPCGRNKAYAVIRELKESSYVVAHEELQRGRFHKLTYYVFDEPLSDPREFLRRLGCERDRQVPADNPPKAPCAQNRDAVPAPHPQKRDPENGHIKKEGKKQKNDFPPPVPPELAARFCGEDGMDFGDFWVEWPAASRPTNRRLAGHLFDQLSLAERKLAKSEAAKFRAAQIHRGQFPAMIPYLRARLFAEFEHGPEFTADGYFRITPGHPEWSHWRAALLRTVSEASWLKQESQGYLLTRTRWPARVDSPPGSARL